ncbi:MAG: hypothetical protein COU06_00985 [Candidatus Harrisonbacteria bacterium CG10_big_fil_rev_8_21_14_0_10_38_8]|uniref:DUF3105 domain-containing protein n=1 Tax=Candidatus Harrisonbacteria bacterium CG10_big_fil_rev_8_21_14_0_10_38_8 TaxID=1974582 RepID=A0A2M6WKE9_9BACT|nr:MAG: hypothetical protein COU06_00985 [Candidatus Harrisonbacteria bacterium CG10_big_fil_rev_8_21_14_0_10_38_8]
MSKNKYQIQKQERELEREKKRQQDKSVNKQKKITSYVSWFLAFILIGYGFFLITQALGPKGEDFSVAYKIQGRDHIGVNIPHPPYNSNPPSSGWHYTSPALGRFYNDPLPDEQVIHNLEHGDIWITYHPSIGDKAKEILRSFAGQYVVVSPRIENEGDISIVSWGRVDTFNVEDEVVNKERIKDFIKRYDNRGPERVRGAQPRHGF